MEVKTVTCDRRKVRAKIGLGDIRVVFGLHGLCLVHWVGAITAAEGDVVDTVDDSHRVGEIRRRTANGTDAVELAVSNSPLCRFRKLEVCRREAGRLEEADLVLDNSIGDKEAVVQRAEAERLVRIRKSEVQGLQEQGLAGEVGGVACEDRGVEGRGVLLCDGVGDDAAEGVADSDHLLEFHVAEGAFAERARQGVGDFDFERGLYGLDRVWLLGLADA